MSGQIGAVRSLGRSSYLSAGRFDGQGRCGEYGGTNSVVYTLILGFVIANLVLGVVQGAHIVRAEQPPRTEPFGEEGVV